ncbi:MAG: AMP-binding protein [Actinomycetota bacterium]|nr:AMP-binding protein [Actinomycetota bacterium]
MTDLLAAHAGNHPDKAAIIDDRLGVDIVTLTFAELDRRANQLAAVLLESGARPGTKVLTWGQNSSGLLVASNALRRIGAVAVPLNYRLVPEEAAYVIDNSDATVVYIDAEYTGVLDQIRASVPNVAEVLVFDGDGELEARLDAAPTEPPSIKVTAPPATMIYTSGTTGRPKGAVRRSAIDPGQVSGLLNLVGYVPDDVYLTTGPLYHSGPGGFAAIAHALGNTIVIQHRFDPEDWLRLVQTYRVTTTFTAPTPIRMITALPDEVKARYDRSSMRRLIANAAPWTLALKKRYLADFPPDSLWEVYGSTELGVDTVLAPEDHLRKPGSCGKPAPGIEIVLFDAEGNQVRQPGVTGELYVRAGTVFSGYHKAEEKYRESSRGDFHTVGDIAYFDADGYLYIADRKADMIISGGMNIYPAEIEAALDAYPDIEEVAVFGVDNEEWGESVHAAIVPAHIAVTAEEVVAFARQHMARYKVPRSITFVNELPKTGSGKVLKRQLKADLAAIRP